MRWKLSVQFQGEEGIDAGGVTREWYQARPAHPAPTLTLSVDALHRACSAPQRSRSPCMPLVCWCAACASKACSAMLDTEPVRIRPCLPCR